jgi:hypothetical protein
MERSLTVLIHGASKAGKSTLAVTAPAPRLLCDVESASRFLPIERVFWDPADPPPKYDGTWDTCVVPTRDWSTVEKVYQWLASGKHEFSSFIIDSISELQNRYIESVAGRRQLTQAQWGDAYRAVGGLVRDIRDLTMHPTKPMECIVMTAMTRQIDEKFRPWCQGQLQAVLPYLMDSVVYIYVDQEVDELSGERTEVRRVLTRPTSEYEAGERVGGAWPIVITDPNIDTMISMIFDKHTPLAEEGLPAAPTPPPSAPTKEDDER